MSTPDTFVAFARRHVQLRLAAALAAALAATLAATLAFGVAYMAALADATAVIEAARAARFPAAEQGSPSSAA